MQVLCEREYFVVLDWRERDVDEVFAQYVDSVLDLARSGVVDVLAHLDVIEVAEHKAPRLAEHEARLVEGLADSDVGIEFSSAGFRKPVDDMYPSASLLDALLAADMDLTTASDGHTLGSFGVGRQLRTQRATTSQVDPRSQYPFFYECGSSASETTATCMVSMKRLPFVKSAIATVG